MQTAKRAYNFDQPHVGVLISGVSVCRSKAVGSRATRLLDYGVMTCRQAAVNLVQEVKGIFTDLLKADESCLAFAKTC